jgi:hypothetical protein
MRDRETVTARPLWTSPTGGNAGAVVHDGLLYGTTGASDRGGSGALRYVVKDTATGRQVAAIDTLLPGGSGDAYTPVAMAGDVVFASAGNAIATVAAGAHPRVLARMQNERMYAQPAFDGERTYLRTYESLLCLARKGEAGDAFERRTRATTLVGMFPGRIEKPVVAQVRTRFDGTIPDGLPVQFVRTGGRPSAWLFAGPFPVQADPSAVVALATPSNAWPREGETLELGGTTHRWVSVPAAGKDRKGPMIDAGGDPPGGSDRLYYTVLDNRVGARLLRLELGGNAVDAIVGGRVVRTREWLDVRGCGLLPVFVRVRFAGGLPPFMRRGTFQFLFTESPDPRVAFARQIDEIRTHADALTGVQAELPGSREAARAGELLTLLRLHGGEVKP